MLSFTRLDMPLTSSAAMSQWRETVPPEDDVRGDDGWHHRPQLPDVYELRRFGSYGSKDWDIFTLTAQLFLIQFLTQLRGFAISQND